MKYFSTFSGIGGFELGIKQAYEGMCLTKQGKGKGVRGSKRQRCKCTDECSDRFTCVGYSEIDKYAVQVYEKHFPNHKNYGDITKIDARTLPDFDLLCGGFPCQAFSIAGKRGGFNDTRGTLFFDVAKILEEKQPRLCLLENVKGLLSHEQGATFRTIISTLDELGYDAEWQVLNSKDFGVPQNRERVFIIGYLRGTSRPEVFPLGRPTKEDVEENTEKQKGESWVSTIDSRYGQRWSSETYVRQIVPTIRAEHHNTDDVHFVAMQWRRSERGNRQPFIRTENMNGDGFENPYAGTIRAGASRNNNLVNNTRRLTPTECERLQGFPDGWTEGLSDTQRYKCLGNAVTVNVIKEIAKRL